MGLNFGRPCDSVCSEFQMPDWQRKIYSCHLDKLFIENHCKLASAKMSKCFTHYVGVTMLTATKY